MLQESDQFGREHRHHGNVVPPPTPFKASSGFRQGELLIIDIAFVSNLFGDRASKPKSQPASRDVLTNGLLGLLVGSLAVFHSRLEILDALAQPLTQIGQLAGAKNQQRNSEDDENLRQPQFTNH